MEKRDAASTLGRLTYVDLADTEDFLAEAAEDGFGGQRAPLSRQIARMGAELSADAYSLNVKPWLDAGWEDCTFVVEDRIVMLGGEGDTRPAALEGAWKRRRARSLLQGGNPITDMMRALRQVMVTDLGKAIVMTRRTGDGRLLVAISFIGTTEKYFDWFANFKFQQQTGMHSGFYELARAFDAQASRILLPHAAKALGEDTFTLADAVLEAQKPDGRVRLWLTGHSQGGAIVQTYTELLRARGVRADRVLGYTYAAPTVAALEGLYDPKAYPIYNIVNTDDIVTRVGSQVRLGVDCLYRPTEAFRMRHYRVEEGAKEAVDRVMFHTAQVRSTADAICWGLAFMRGMRDLDSADLRSLIAAIMPQMLMLRRLNLDAMDVSSFFSDLLEGQYRKLTGQAPEKAQIKAYADSFFRMLSLYGAKETSAALVKGIVAPHRVRPDKEDEAFEPPYIAIVRRYLDGCEQGIWLPDAPARCVSAEGATLLPSRRRPGALPEGAKALPDTEGDHARRTTGGEDNAKETQ